MKCVINSVLYFLVLFVWYSFYSMCGFLSLLLVLDLERQLFFMLGAICLFMFTLKSDWGEGADITNRFGVIKKGSPTPALKEATTHSFCKKIFFNSYLH